MFDFIAVGEPLLEIGTNAALGHGVAAGARTAIAAVVPDNQLGVLGRGNYAGGLSALRNHAGSVHA